MTDAAPLPPFLDGLPPRRRAALAAACELRRLDAGDSATIGADAPGLAYLVAGAARASTLPDAAGRVTYRDLAAGDVLGLAEAAAGETPPPAVILALEPSRILLLPLSALQAALRANASAWRALAAAFAARLLAAEREAAAAAPHPLATVYRELMRRAAPGQGGAWTLDPMPRHRELAEAAGVDEEAAARAVAELVRLGAAKRRYPALDILDPAALSALAR